IASSCGRYPHAVGKRGAAWRSSRLPVVREMPPSTSGCTKPTVGIARSSCAIGITRGGRAVTAFNWSAIDWVSLVALSVLVLVAARIGERLSFGSRGLGALVTALIFAAGFAAWSYFSLHDTLSQAVATLMPSSPG